MTRHLMFGIPVASSSKEKSLEINLMEKQDKKISPSLSGEREYLLQALQLAEEMMDLSKRGTRFTSDNGCLILYGVIRDCAFKIKKIAEEQLIYYNENKENKEE